MATLAQLRAAVQTLLQHPTSAALLQLNSNTRERAYEAYVFGLCCEAVRKAQGTVVLVGAQTGDNPNPMVFRGAPGSMASSAQDFVYARCQLAGKRFEIHVDVEYQGNSEALHEIDVSICEERHAASVRTTGRTPKASGRQLIMLFECKFYDSTPGVALGRTFVGLVSDCSGHRLSAFVSNLTSRSLHRYLSPSPRPEPFLGLTPLDADSEQRFIRTVEQELRKWARP